ncbi:hypothetical protein DL546_008121 [Coniochaeta pulveracea]|uniref:Uncharacterized protein n=1 Tax=Coniochaeta pulveracea TaxID=177199 RepID=A0A420YMT0_9PEZI|nr:hypothetical protein DL546_008121 [Coniochaeta pulveracea]
MGSFHRLVDRTKFALDSTSHLMHPDFERIMEDDYPFDMHVKFVGPFYDTGLARNPSFSSNFNTFLKINAQPGRPKEFGLFFLDNVQNTACFILRLLTDEVGLTPEIIKEAELDPLVVDWGNRICRETSIAEEEGYQMANPKNGKTGLWPARILQKRQGDEMEARLCVRMVALVIRSLQRFALRARTGKTTARFRILPYELELDVLQWARAWSQWSLPRSRKSPSRDSLVDLGVLLMDG